jgi:hypothetical protein
MKEEAENIISSEIYKGYKIEVLHDIDSESPRGWDNLGKMLCWNRRYTLGDAHDLIDDKPSSWDKMIYTLEHTYDAAIIITIYSYEHGNITISTKPFSCPWDSGTLGVIYADRATIRGEYGCKYMTKKILGKVRELLEDEVEIYNKYLTGNVYAYRLYDASGKEIDSCYGCYYDNTNDIIVEVKELVDWIIKEKGGC